MTVLDFSPERTALMVNGDRVRYNRLEIHNEHYIFFRGKIGIVYAAFKDSIVTLNEKEQAKANDSNGSVLDGSAAA